MRKNENFMNIEGKIYQFDLAEKVTGENSKNPGTKYIGGTLDVAIDSSQSEIIQVHYTYVTPTYSSGKANSTYTALKQIIDSGKTVITDGYDAATVVKLNPSYAVNDWYPEGKTEVVSSPRNEGGFVTIVAENSLHPEGDVGRNKFSFDVVINSVAEVEPEDGESYATIKGVAFDFRNAVLPVTLVARNKEAIKYFVNLDASNSNPVYTKIWGKIVNTFEKIEKTTESAFGEATVDVVTRRHREYLITGANPVPYEFDTDETITAKELEKALQDREVYLADVKKKSDEYKASKSASAPAAAAVDTSVKQAGFKF